MPYYLNNFTQGLKSLQSNGDGYGIFVKWFTAYPVIKTNSIAYNIYMQTTPFTFPDEIFLNPPAYVAFGVNQVDIYDLTPGQMYFFGVRAIEYDPTKINLNLLPSVFNGLKVYPTSLLRSNMTDTQLSVPLLDSTGFPTSGFIRVGVEVMSYTSISSNNLVVSTRGLFNTIPRIHHTDGYDGLRTRGIHTTFFLGNEELNTKVNQCQSRIDVDNHSYTTPDGYRQRIKDDLSTDLSGSDAFNQNFNSYDYAGWHRTDPVLLLNGECVGSYIGGEQYCADGYDGVFRTVRGLSVQERNNQNQETLLSITGEPVCLLKRETKGINCKCYLPSSEYPDDRCPECYGTGFISGWEQFYNPRSSDGRILVRFGPAPEALKSLEAGQESEFNLECWTLTVPTIKTKDILVRFDEDDNEEFRYEVMNVTRNKMISRLQGGQKFQVQRIRKTDPAYQVKVFRNTSFFPKKLQTGATASPGIPSHSHTITVNESVTNLNQINQMTGIAAGHNHAIVNGVVQDALSHTHTIVLV